MIEHVFRELIIQPFILLMNTPFPNQQRLVDLLFHRADFKIFDWSDDFEEFSCDINERSLTCKDS